MSTTEFSDEFFLCHLIGYHAICAGIMETVTEAVKEIFGGKFEVSLFSVSLQTITDIPGAQ